MNGGNQSSQPQATPSSLLSPMEGFLDDFDDDDDEFFGTNTKLAQPTREQDEQEGANALTKNSFGMLTITHDLPRSTASTTTAAVGEDELPTSDDVELEEMWQHLVHLRNANSTYRSVAASCLVIHRSLYNGDRSSSSHNQQRISSITNVLHSSNYQAYISQLINSLTLCLSQHNLNAARTLAAKTMGALLRSCYAKCQFDSRIISEIPTSEYCMDDCLAAAYSLVHAALESTDSVSSAALESLGMFTLDASNDSLMAEVYSLVECGDPNSFVTQTNGNLMATNNSVMKEIQFKVYNHVIFPRMAKLLHRISLYAPHHLMKVIPVLTDAFQSAFEEGPETIPARRAMATNKITHGKRGWMETDATNLVCDYVEILMGCFDNEQTRRAASLACIRLANVCPLAPWRPKASKCAVACLIGILNNETALISSDKTNEKVSSTLSVAVTPPESIGATVALLLIALRGIPLHERAAGLVSALHAIMMFLPMGVTLPVASECQRLDVPVSFVQGEKCVHRLGRVGLLAEIALLIMIDGKCSIDHAKVDEFIEKPATVGDNADNDKEMISGSRAILLNHLLQSHHLSSTWDTQQKKNERAFRPVDELIWVFCSTLLQLGRLNEPAFTKDFSLLIEWSNLGLVMLDNFGKFVCRPITPSPFSHAAHASYMDLMTSLLKKSGLFPLSGLSIRDNMLPIDFLPEKYVASLSVMSNRFDLSVLGGPGRQMPRISSAISRICQNILVLWNKSRTAYPLVEGSSSAQSCANIVMAAILVDAWLGRCISNHDTKQSNERQIEAALSLLSLIQTEMNYLLESHGMTNDSKGILNSLIKSDPSSYFNATVHLFRVCMASLEAVAKMSVLMWDVESRNKKGDDEVSEDTIGPLAVSVLHAFIESSKEALDLSANAGRDVMVLSLYQQVAIDANDTIARIAGFSPANAKQKSNHDDIATLYQPSSFLSSREGSKGKVSLENMIQLSLTCSTNMKKQGKKASFNDLSFVRELPPALISQLKPMYQTSFFLYHHARLAVTRLVTNAYTTCALAFSSNAAAQKDVHPFNPYRLSTSFQHTRIEMYRRPLDLPVLIPVPTNQQSPNNTFIGDEPIALTGCSDPVSLTMAYDLRRIRRGDLSEEAMLVVTMRLYNITPVPIRNGVKLDLRIVENDSGSNSIATAVYKNQIKGGDFVTWETRVGNFKAGMISLQASVTFRDMEQESITRKWVSLDDDGGNAFIQDEEDEGTTDITITCRPVTISAVALLQPCPLVIFGSKQREISGGLGDGISFSFLWSNMTHECSKNLVCQGTGKLQFDDMHGYVILELPDSNNTSSGCAFITPSGNRVMCLLEDKGNSSHLLRVQSDSKEILQSLVGSADAQSSWLAFLFGNSAAAMLEATSCFVQPKLEHDFASMTMPHHQLEHDFASMAMPHHQLGHDFASMTMPHHQLNESQ